MMMDQVSLNIEKENVLKPFYRMDESRSQNKSGVGLGLSISYDIIRSHGGDMLLETSPQKGLRVKYFFAFFNFFFFF